MTEREPGSRLVVSIAELRELRRSERAPEALQRRVSERSRRRASQPAPRSLAFGCAGGALLLALLIHQRRVSLRGPEFAIAPEPASALGFAPGGAIRVPATLTPALTGSAAEQAFGGAEPARGATRKSRSSSLAEAFAKKLAANPPLEPSTLGNPAPELQPGLLRGLPARRLIVPGFPVTAEAAVRELPLPAALGPNLVTNGDFAHGTALWSVRRWDDFVGPAPTVLAPFDVVNGALCTTLSGGELVVGGWPWAEPSLSPHSFELERGQRYRLSLRAWTKGPLPVALVFKVGHQHEPYNAAVVATVPVTQLPHLFSVTFEPHADDAEAGIAFAASALATPEARRGSSALCIDDVRVTREARPL